MLTDVDGNKSFAMNCAVGDEQIELDATHSWPIAGTPRLGDYQDNLHETTWLWSLSNGALSPTVVVPVQQNYVSYPFNYNELKTTVSIDQLVTNGMLPGTDYLLKLHVDAGKDSDQEIYSDTDEISFRVNFDTEPPVISGIEESIIEWPPNHKYRTFTIADFVTDVTDNCTLLTIDDLVITAVSSDEQDNAKGDGNTTDDIIIATDGKSVDLRSERQGMNDGRAYTISIQAEDESGNIATEDFQVDIPHDMH